MHSKRFYLDLRARHRPGTVKFLFVLESPPTSGNFFYDPTGRVTEPLFSAMMKIIGHEASSKEDGLAAFASKGCFLVDATYRPVNQIQNQNRRNQVILSDLPDLIQDLRSIIESQADKINIVLVKANICRLLEERLSAIGMNVINDKIMIPFPSHGNQKRFYENMRKVLKSVREFLD